MQLHSHHQSVDGIHTLEITNNITTAFYYLPFEHPNWTSRGSNGISMVANIVVDYGCIEFLSSIVDLFSQLIDLMLMSLKC